MTAWTRGYASDITYTRGVYRELSPHWLDGALLLAGVTPPPAPPAGAPPPGGTPDSPVWLELGCGHGLSALALAAARPDLTVIGVDFNPAHIAGARHLARAAGLDNARFEEVDFADMAAEPGAWPMADHVALHGVYTWVGAESRAHIARFLGRRLRPGGVAYLSYNCLPGWAPSLPVQYLLQAYGAALPGPSAQAGDRGRDLLLGLLNQGAGYFAGNAAASARVERLRQAGDAYLVHEFMHAGWQPLYHAQVAADLAAAKLDFAASAAWGENFPDLLMTPAQAALLADAPTAPLRETLKDYLTAQPLRRDLFVRGVRPLEAAARHAALSALVFAPLGDPDAPLPPPALPVGEAPAEILARLAPLRAHFRAGPRALGDLPAWDAAWGTGDADALAAMERALALLVAMDALTPAAPVGAMARAALDRLEDAAARHDPAALPTLRLALERWRRHPV